MKQLFSATPLVVIGRYSYGIYLLHMPIVFFVKDRVTGDPQLGMAAILGLTIALASSAALSRRTARNKIEQPTCRFSKDECYRGSVCVIGRSALRLARRPGILPARLPTTE